MGTVPLSAESWASAPRPIARLFAEPGADWVLEHVGTALLEMVLSIDHVDGVPAAEEVAPPTVALVEALRIAAVQTSHPLRQIRLVGLHYQVVVRGHQTKRMAGPGVTRNDASEQRQERLAVDVIGVDRGVVDATVCDVVDAAREVGSCSSRNRPKVRTNLAVRQTLIGTVPVRGQSLARPAVFASARPEALCA